ncbi:hypothetical protein [Sandaracinus amylolyticus]|uniref:hypothetical protein n=1 Tax=Sandaracinus amylolyticus TaxID=927083 RepID=UPI001F343F5F|nr:hypothetical protein [Sandaracinus amylolyticus]UJR80644.1 Hypothetical protein I5071_26930 [Sandaracinus amylolyticus]
MVTESAPAWSRGERISWALAGIALAAVCIAHASFGYSHSDLSGHALGSDDAFISFRYAERLLAGDGLVFNAGERVEGFTNLGYLLLCVPGLALLGRDGVIVWAVGLNVLAALGAAGLVASWLRRALPAHLRSIAPWVVAIQPALWIAVASGLETPVVVLLQIALWRLVDGVAERDRARPLELVAMAVIAIGAVLVRADGFIGVGIAVVFLALRRHFGVAGALATAGALAFAAVLAFRLSYYGDVLPNTYYAKVSAPFWMRVPAGLVQLGIVATQQGFALELVAIGAAWILARRGGRLVPSYAAFLGAGVVAYWVWVGGDVFQERFLVGLYLVGSALALSIAASTSLARWIPAIAGALVVVQLLPCVFDLRFRYTTTRTDRWVALGRHLAEHAPGGATIAVDAAGKIPFFSGLRAIDMLGLNDRELAHRERTRFDVGHDAYDPDYVLGRRPDLVACWIEPDLDMFYGLDRARWEGAGYRLRWLVFADENDHGRTEILDAREVPEALVPALIRAGFRYAVLDRAE